MSAPQDSQQPPTLDRLYSQLGHASVVADELREHAAQLAEQITAKQQELQQQRQAAEEAQDKAAVEQIDTELAQLDEAYQTLTEDLDAPDEHQDADGAGDQRGSERDAGSPGA